MKPKDYYDQFSIHEDSRYVFALIPPGFRMQYHKFIKEPIEKIELDEGKITCESYQDFEPSADLIDELWRSIQKAGIIIANITDFKPNVMLGLGVALAKKRRIIIIAENSLDGRSNLPFVISTINIEFYEPGEMDKFSDWIVTQVEKWITPDEPKLKDTKVIGLMNTILGLRREEKFDAALLLFESVDMIEPGNWYIYKEWGITFKEKKDYDNACQKLQKALEFTRSNKNKSEIYTELGVVYMEDIRVNDALVAFEKAENLNRDNACLYEKWAYLYFSMGKYADALDKILLALKLNKNHKVYRWLFEFYSKKYLDNYSMGIGEFLAMKRDEESTTIIPQDTNSNLLPKPLRPFLMN